MNFDVIANVAATCSSAIIAGVALRFSYLQNVGWKPVALLDKASLHGVGGSSRFFIRLHLEFWNRRKHPVIIKDLRFTPDGFNPSSSLSLSERTTHELSWVTNFGWKILDEMVDPATRTTQILDLHFDCEELEKLRASISCKLRYYDPVQNREHIVALEHRFMFPGLGWKKGQGNHARDELDKSVIRGARRDQRSPV